MEKTDLKIDFGAGGNSVGFVADGWSSPETHGTWSEGTDSILSIQGLVKKRSMGFERFPANNF